MNIDVKEAGSIPAAVAAVERCRAWDRTCVTSFSWRRTSRMRRLSAAGALSAAHPVEVLAHRWALPWPASAAVRLQVPVQVGGRTLLDAAFVARAHRRGQFVDVWTVNDTGEMSRLLDLGVDGIMTDYPSVLRDVLRQRGAWSR